MSKSKLLSIILISALVLTCALSLVSCVDKGNEYLTHAKIDLHLQENGDMHVTETWSVKIRDEEIHNLYREIDLYDNKNSHYSVLKDFKVVNNATGEVLSEAYNLKNPAKYDNNHLDNHSYVYETKNSSGNVVGAEVGFYMPYTSYQELSYTMSYTITDMVIAYQDVAVLYYKPFSTDFSLYIDSIDINVYLPNGAQTTSDTLAFLHTELAESYSQVESQKVVATAGEFEQGESVEIRVLMPTNCFSGVQKSYTEQMRQSIVDQERAWYESYQATVLKERRTAVTALIIGCILVVVAIALVVYFNVFYKKVKGEYPPYVREIPSGTTSTQMAHFYYHYSGTLKKQKNKGNVLSALLMELTRKGFLVLDEDPQNPDDFTIDVESIPTPKLNELHGHERVFYDLIVKVRASFTTPITMKDFEHYAKDHAKEVNHVIDQVVKSSGKGYNKAENFKHPTFKSQSWFGIGLVATVVGFMIFMVSELLNYFGLGLAIAGIILMIGYPRVNKLSAIGEAKYMEAKGLEAFMLDFSNLKEHEIPALILWEEYMVYATMMGISERVLAELKLKYPKLMEQGEYTGGYYRNRSYLYFYVHMNMHHHGSFDLGASLNRSLQNISTTSHHIVQAAKAQSTASKFGGSGGFGRGGGGFSGGGGGFGGGGGGAR